MKKKQVYVEIECEYIFKNYQIKNYYHFPEYKWFVIINNRSL